MPFILESCRSWHEYWSNALNCRNTLLSVWANRLGQKEIPVTKPQRLTLKTVAQILGVSNATVSNAFNRPDQLSQKRREEILAACAELGYAGPNQAARSLRRGRSGIVALVLPDSLEYMVADPVASKFIQGITSVLESAKINLLLFSGKSDSLSSVVDFVDGFICYGTPRNNQLAEQLTLVQKQVVTVDFSLPDRASVNIDNQAAARQIANRALTQSARHIAILGLRLLPGDQVCRVYEADEFSPLTSISHLRLSGYQQALADHGLHVAVNQLWNIPESTLEQGAIAAKAALSSTPRPDVLLCMSDLIALAALKEANKIGLNVPQDVRIVGFDGIDEALRSTPPLRTVHQNSVEKGRCAAELYLSQTSQQQMLNYTLIAGQSSGYKR